VRAAPVDAPFLPFVSDIVRRCAAQSAAVSVRGTMIRSRLVAAALLALSALVGCGNNGSSASPPVGGLTTSAGDGNIIVTWADDLTTDYWLFVSTDPTMTTENFSTRTDIRVIRSARSPYVLCNYPNDRTLYMAMDGRTGAGPGGAGTPTVNATLRAAGAVWTLGTAPATDFRNVLRSMMLTFARGQAHRVPGKFYAAAHHVALAALDEATLPYRVEEERDGRFARNHRLMRRFSKLSWAR